MLLVVAVLVVLDTFTPLVLVPPPVAIAIVISLPVAFVVARLRS
jgi:hypothetical protein